MASDSELLAHGYKELSNVMQELKEWTAVLFMPIKICNSKGELLTETYHDTDIWTYYNIQVKLGKDIRFILIFLNIPLKMVSTTTPMDGKNCIVLRYKPRVLVTTLCQIVSY